MLVSFTALQLLSTLIRTKRKARPEKSEVKMGEIFNLFIFWQFL